MVTNPRQKTMHIALKPPFNVFTWSLAILGIFGVLQGFITIALALWGQQPHFGVGIFNWFAISAALSFSLHTRYKPQRSHLALLAAFACFYIVAISLAFMFRSPDPIDATRVVDFLARTVGLYVISFLGIGFGRYLREKISR